MKHIEIDEAQPIFEILVDDVSRGATIMLTRNGIVVAKMIPLEGEAPKGDATPQQA